MRIAVEICLKVHISCSAVHRPITQERVPQKNQESADSFDIERIEAS